MYEGFSEYLEAKGEKTAYKSPAETTVAAQVQMLDELITQNVASITISTNGDAGYDEVFKKAQEKGIPIVIRRLRGKSGIPYMPYKPGRDTGYRILPCTGSCTDHTWCGLSW